MPNSSKLTQKASNQASAPYGPIKAARHNITHRVIEQPFNASLLSQMRTVDFINRLLAD